MEAPLWEQAVLRGIVYGSSTATCQVSDTEYRRLLRRQAAMLFNRGRPAVEPAASDAEGGAR